MNVSFFKEVLDSGWSSLREEYNKSSNEILFNKCGNFKLLDSRDTDFNEIENRVAYMYKFGESVKILVETSISSFFKQCSEEEMIYFSNNGKICSLSNGPGLDIIGYLSALVKSNKQLNCYPILMGINLYGSWRDLFQRVTSVAREYCAKSYPTCSQNLSENVQFIQCDIFSTLSNEAKECITNSDILLMCKVFSSTKANPEIVNNTLKEILILLKPGSMIFFIASKRNVKNVSSLSFLKEFIEIKFGPLKVTLENVLLDAGVSDATDLKLEPVEKSYFMVMQKKTTKRKRGCRGRKGKKKIILPPSVSSCDISITDNSKVEDTDSNSCISVADSNSCISIADSNSCISVTDSNSCISVSSSFKQFDITSDESKSVSSENVSHVGVTHLKGAADSINKKELLENVPHYTFQTKLKTFLNKNSSTEHSCIVDEPVVAIEGNTAKPIIENVFDKILKNTSSKKFSEENDSSKSVLMEIIDSNSNSKDDSLNKIDLNDALSSGIRKSDEQFYNSNIEFKKPIQSEHLNVNEMTSTFQFSSPDKYIPPHKKNTAMKTFDKPTFHGEQMKTVNNTDCLDRNGCLGSEIDFANESRKFLQKIYKIDKSCENVFQLKKNTDCWEERKKQTSYNSHKSFRDSSQLTAINSASFSENELKTKTERKQKKTEKFSSENSFDFSENNTCAKEFINTRNKDTMLERCEILVTALEGLVANISKNVDSMNMQRSEVFCNRTESCTKCRHLCACSSCFYEQSCSRKYCCRRTKNHVCIDCSSSKSLCYTCNHQMHACNYDVDKSRSSREPYLVLPVQNEDIPFILNLVSKNS